MAPHPEPPPIPPSVVRPFLGRAGLSISSNATSGPDTVRAYVMTGGRTSSRTKLDFHSMLSVIPAALQIANTLNFERAKVIEHCRNEVLSVAELAVRIGVPIGVIQIIGGDLVEDGFLQAHTTDQNINADIALLERLLRGIRSL
jgi:Protein of unknown function (DUF742)